MTWRGTLQVLTHLWYMSTRQQSVVPEDSKFLDGICYVVLFTEFCFHWNPVLVLCTVLNGNVISFYIYIYIYIYIYMHVHVHNVHT